ADRVLLNNAYRALDHFNGTDVFALFRQRRQIHMGRVRVFIEGKYIDTIHGSWVTLFYLVKQRRKIGPLITIGRFSVVRIALRAEVFAVLLVLVRTTRGEHHGGWTGLIERHRVGCHRRQPSKYEASYNAKYSHPTKYSHTLKLRHQTSSRTGFTDALAQLPREANSSISFHYPSVDNLMQELPCYAR